MKGQSSSHFLTPKTPQMQSIAKHLGSAMGSAWLVLCNFNIIYPHPHMELFFQQIEVKYSSFQLMKRRFRGMMKIHFWMCSGMKLKNFTKQTLDQWSGGLKINLCFKSNKLFWCKIDQKSGRESQSNLAILQQMGRESYIYSVRLKFHFCTFCVNLTFTTCCCISSLFVPNHWRCFKCLAFVWSLWSMPQCLRKRGRDGGFSANSSANAPTSKCLNRS